VVAEIVQHATVHRDEKLAELVLENLPAQPPAGAVGLLLRFFADHASQKQNRENVILKLFSDRLLQICQVTCSPSGSWWMQRLRATVLRS
jgi:hypothetical protein